MEFDMPIYEYKCNKCKLEFEKMQSMDEKHVSICPECGSDDTKRVFSSILINIISDTDLSARLQGVPKKRLDMTKHLKEQRSKRKKDPSSRKDEESNELHTNERRQNLKY